MVRNSIFMIYCAVFSFSSQVNTSYTEHKALQDANMPRARAIDFDTTKIKAQKKLEELLRLEQRPMIAAQPDEEEFFDAVEYFPTDDTLTRQVSEDDNGYLSRYNSDNNNDGYASDSSGYDSDDDEGFGSIKIPRLKMPGIKVEQSVLMTEYPSITVASSLKREPSYVTSTMRPLYGRTEAYDFIDTLGNKQRSMKFNVINTSPNTRTGDYSLDSEGYLDMLAAEVEKGNKDLQERARLKDEAYIKDLRTTLYPQEKSFTESLALKAKAVYSYFFGK